MRKVQAPKIVIRNSESSDSEKLTERALAYIFAIAEQNLELSTSQETKNGQ